MASFSFPTFFSSHSFISFFFFFTTSFQVSHIFPRAELWTWKVDWDFRLSALAPSVCQLAILATFLRLLFLLCVCVCHSVLSDSLQPHRLLCPLQQPGSSVHGILQARILAWISVSFSRGSSWLRDQTLVSCTATRFFTVWAIGEALFFFS